MPSGSNSPPQPSTASSDKENTTELVVDKTPSFFVADDGIRYPFFIGFPWNPTFHISIRGAENTHTYFWIIKDLSWTQRYEYVGMLFGTCALAWCLLLFAHAYAHRNVEEIYMLGI